MLEELMYKTQFIGYLTTVLQIKNSKYQKKLMTQQYIT